MAAGEGATRRAGHQGELRCRGWAMWPRGSLGEWRCRGRWRARARFVEEDEIVADNDKTLWQQTWRVWLTRNVDLLRASVQKLTGLHTTLSPTGDEPVARHLVVDSGV